MSATEDLDEESSNQESADSRAVADHASAKHARTPKSAPADTEAEAEASAAQTESVPGSAKHRQLWQWAKTHLSITIPVAVVVLLAVLFAVPFTRYVLAGTVLRRSFAVAVVDQQTGKPVSSATITLEGKQAATNNQGIAKIRVNVGNATLLVSKTYYQSVSESVLVPIGSQKQPVRVKLKATGRQVPVTVINKITGKPVTNAVVKAAKTEVKTDAHGQAVMVLPADQASVAGTVSLGGYNTATIKVMVTSSVDPGNTFAVTPAGKLYFLSNKSGKIDVVKTDLDGQNRQTILAGTGNESANDTSLLASRDWKFLLLKASRDEAGKPKLYLLDTASDKLSTVDEGDATFSLIGWSGHTFVYWLERTNVQYYEPNHQAVKSFDADSSKLITLDQTQGEGDQGHAIYQQYEQFIQIGNQLIYPVRWLGFSVPGKTNVIRSIQVDGQNKKDLKSFDSATTGYIQAALYKPDEVYFQQYVYGGSKNAYFEYEDGAIKAKTDLTDAQFNQPYPTFLLSPSGNQTFWSEQRDGKNALFVGDEKGEGGKQIATLSDYNIYGWFTDQYLLESKNSSELYILPAAGLTGNQQPLKVSDYFKPVITYPGYGGGYGGF
ncbi:MAG TPA: hypothetical protein VLI54_00235 [Bacillota bacterium]|nr:hypothetical protein [Bacillota bacterium]